MIKVQEYYKIACVTRFCMLIETDERPYELISNKFIIFNNIKIAKILLIVKIFRCLTSESISLAQSTNL